MQQIPITPDKHKQQLVDATIHIIVTIDRLDSRDMSLNGVLVDIGLVVGCAMYNSLVCGVDTPIAEIFTRLSVDAMLSNEDDSSTEFACKGVTSTAVITSRFVTRSRRLDAWYCRKDMICTKSALIDRASAID
jgi:hypothetical protein